MKFRSRPVLALLVAAAAVGAASAGSSLRCEATLTGAQEVPAFDTPAAGKVFVQFDSGFTRAEVLLLTEGVPDAFAAHFHCSRPGANGPVAFGMFSPGPLMFDGRSARGPLMNEDFAGNDCVPVVGRPVNNIAALAFAMDDGLIYANVHTPDSPSGELRGQMTCNEVRDRLRGRNHDN